MRVHGEFENMVDAIALRAAAGERVRTNGGGRARLRGRGARRAACAIALAAIHAFVFGCASGGAMTREEALEQVESVGTLDSRLEAAKTEGLDLLAPQGVEAAQRALDQAVAKARSGDVTTAQTQAKDGLDALDRAEQASKQASDVLRDVLERRARAVAAGAPQLLPDRFKELDERLRAAARMVERGDVEDARDEGPALLKAYSALELDSLKVDATDLARKAIDEAKAAGAEKYAPETFGRAKKELEIAVGILETDRSETARANGHARRAAELAARSQHIGEIVKEWDRRDYDKEQIVLWYQEQLGTVLSPLGDDRAFTASNYDVVSAARNEVLSLVEAQREAESQLLDARERIEELEVASTMSEADLIAQMEEMQEAQREAEARYSRIQAMFTEQEAEVYRQGLNVLLETYGFDFPVGQSEIESKNFPLLSKIAKAIREFENPDVVVSGHTDSTGDDAFNMKLSEDRARKVGDFLVEVAGIPRDRVTTRGYGETKPVASNKTEAGRARNRRIEVLIVNRESGGS